MDCRPLYEPLPIDPGPVLDIAEGNQLYQAVAVACRFGLFAALSEKQSAAELAANSGLDGAAVARLLDVLAHAGLLDEQDGSYKTAPAAEAYLRPTALLYLGHLFPAGFAPESFGGLLADCLQGGCRESPEPGWNPEQLRQIGVSGLNGSIQATVAAVDLAGAARLLDLGGGHGFYSIALAQKYPALAVTLFDLPQVVGLAGEYVRKFGLADRIGLVAGDFLKEAIGADYDAVLCANILHSTKRATVLAKVWQALNPGGRIIVKCRVADCRPTLTTALGKLVWLVRGNRELHDGATWHGFLEQQGFKDVKTINIHGLFATMTGVKK
ncbi:methyltransferase [Anaeroselena agilis]|uniref:Methyltransferase n=1 Tax=Anaeroselena agilis TaxID=3063788 RepID=A0ABU3NZE7_9FIRM|nr:methyltransferase [Selenomonadales bacterium 4137-cl]